MRRRTFLKSIGIALSGITGLKLLKPVPEIALKDAIIEWEGGVWCKEPGEHITFTGGDKGSSMTVTLYGVDKDGNCHIIDQQTASSASGSPVRLLADGPGLIVCPEVGKSVPLYGQALKSNQRT